jgi:intein/homing endonuclease
MKLSFLKKKYKESILKTDVVNLQDIIAPSSFELKQNFLRVGERFAKSFFIFSYPRYLSTGWLSPIINMQHPMDISFHIHPVGSNIVLKKLRKKLTEVRAEMMEKEEKGLIRDPILETAYQDIETLRNSLQTAQERVFKFGIYITVYTDTQKELRRIETVLRSILESRLIYIRPALFRQKEGFISSNPYCLDQLAVHTTMNTAPLSSIFPFVSSDLSANEGILYGINMHNNSLVLFDRFTLENANMVIFGKAGGGKSILGNEPVLIKKGRQIQLKRIGPLVEGLIKKYGASQIDEELEGVIDPGIEVYSFDKNLKGSWSKVTVAARKDSPEEFYKFTTRSGRKITTTGDHNMLALKNGEVVATKSTEIKKGAYIPLPREVSKNNPSLKPFNLLNLLQNSKRIYIKNAEDIIKEHYKDLHKISLDKKFDPYLYKYRDGRAIPSKYFRQILNYLKISITDSALKKLEVVSKSGQRKYCPTIIFPINQEFLKIIGYITAEGTVREEVIMISNNDLEVLQDIDLSLKKLKVPFYYGNKGIIIASRVFVEIINALGGREKSKQKKVLPFIFNLGKDKIGAYLSTYFEGDGGVEDNKSITATSKSKRLISEIAYLFYYFGIIGRISKTKKKATNCNWKRKRTYYKLSITGQDNLRKFRKNINFISQRKRKLLSETIKGERNTNVDIVPGLKPIFQEIYQLFSPLFWNIPETIEWKNGKRNPSPQHLKKVVKKIEERIQSFKDLGPTYQVLSELPELATIINLGKNDKGLNQELWKTLGQSWRVVKNENVKPGSINAFKIIEAVNGKSYHLPEIKNALYSGFQEMGLPVKHYNPSLQSALMERSKSNTSYEIIQKSAQFIWQNYQDVLKNKIPQVEKKLNQLKTLANSNLFWDPIVKIQKIKNKKEKYVYDLTVDNEVFLAGDGGMFVHNSYAIKLEILRYLMQGIDTIVIDPENEYKNLSEAVGGSYFKISLTSPDHINPFDLPKPMEDEIPGNVLKSNIINLVGLLRIMLGGLTPKEDAIIDQALIETYASRDITPESDPASWEKNIPILSDFESVLESMQGTESLVERVRKFSRGSYADFFNQQSNVNMNNKFVVFGIRDMEEELRPMAMFIILRHIWNTVRSSLKKRILVVDEAWWIMQSEDGASFLYGICKRGRKYWLGVSTITQDVSDFMKSSYGQPIIANSSLQLLMKQSMASIDVVQKTFNLTEQEKYLLLESGVGEGVFFAGQKHIAIRITASYTEDQIITTSPEQVLEIKKAKRTNA